MMITNFFFFFFFLWAEGVPEEPGLHGGVASFDYV